MPTSRPEVAATARLLGRAPPDPQGKRTRISRDPWSIQTDRSTLEPTRSTDMDDAYPVEKLYRVGQCARGWIPFGGSGQPEQIVYANGLGDRAAWDTDDISAGPVIG